jgi:membrane-associated protein
VDPIEIIKAVGLLGVLAVIFAESGLFFGFFFPGDSLLFTAGLLASQGFFNFPLLLGGGIIAALAGDSVGYWFGKKVGPRIFSREDSFFFHKRHIQRAELFYEKYGNKTIVLARFVPVIRTFAPIVAGVGRMEYKKFFFWNAIGGIFWVAIVTGLGYFLGRSIPDVDSYILPIIIVIVLISVIPVIFEYLKERV